MYRTVDAAFWTDPKVRKLNPSERLLFLYLITNPHTHVSGLYYLPNLIMQYETGLPPKQLNPALDTLSKVGICLSDRLNEIVWVVKMFRFQGSGQKNTLSAAHHISKDIHKSFLINEFLKEYPEVSPHVKIGYTVGATPHSPFPIPDSPLQRTEQEKGTTPSAKADVAAELFRSSYLANIGNPYGWQTGDFPQLAKLRKRLDLGSKETPEHWEAALLNYFASPFSEFSLQHFAAKFDTFMNSSLDRFKTPVRHKGNGNGIPQNETASERRSRKNREVADEILNGLDDAT